MQLLFSPLVRILWALRLESLKKITLSTWSWCGTFGISVSSAERLSHNPFRTLSLCFRVIGKTPDLISRNNFVKKLSASAIAIMSWQCDSIFPLLMCQAVWNKTCTQLSLSQILFQNPKKYSLGDVKRFCYHSWCGSAVIFDQIIKSSNVYIRSSRFWPATCLVNFYQLPSVSRSRIPPKNLWSVHSLIPISLLHQYYCFCRR